MDILNALFRWLHILAGIIWIGMLYSSTWSTVLSGHHGRGDQEEGRPRADAPRPLLVPLGAAWTWVTGVLLLLLVFYHGGIMFEADGDWSAAAHRDGRVTFLSPFLYDALHKSGLGKDPKASGRWLSSCPRSSSSSWHLGRLQATAAYNIHLGGPVRDHHGLQRLVPDLAGAAEDHPRREGGRGARRRARGLAGAARDTTRTCRCRSSGG